VRGFSADYYNRQGDEGFLHDTEMRGDAWSFRTLTYAAFISPDGSAEKAYFEDKLLNNIAEWEGEHEVQLDLPAKKREWTFGYSKRRDSRGISPLGSWADRGEEFVQPPIKPTAKGAASPWEENFLVNALGIARQFGYPTSALLQFSSRRLIDQALNPETYPEYLEAYRYPTSNAAGKWISTWREFNSYYDYTPAKHDWRTTETVDHSYGLIAMAALSHLVTFSADGYSGRSAWDFVKANKPGQDRFATESPKWALVPLNEPPNVSSPTAAESEEDLTTREPSESRGKHGASDSSSQAGVPPVTQQAPASTAATIAPIAQKKLGDGTGWFRLPKTKLETVCPANNSQYAFHSNCTNVISAWSGGIADQMRNRLLIWGGGHNDYFGNEIYALDLNRMVLTRLNDPSPLYPGPGPLPCKPETPDRKANARHTYGGLSYIAHADRMYVFGGIVACTNGGGSNDTWTLNLDTLQWTRMDANMKSNPRTINGVVMSDYDPNSKLVFIENTRDFYSYNFDTNSYARLQFDAREVSYHMSAVIDPSRKLFVMFGGEWDGNGGIKAINIAPRSNYQVQDWNASTKGCEALRKSAYPGLAYDPVQKVIVGWAGGDSIYLFNPGTKTCTAINYPNGPGAQQPNGTHGRLRYFSKVDAFALVNNSGGDAFLLRVRPSAQTLDSSTK